MHPKDMFKDQFKDGDFQQEKETLSMNLGIVFFLTSWFCLCVCKHFQFRNWDLGQKKTGYCGNKPSPGFSEQPTDVTSAKCRTSKTKTAATLTVFFTIGGTREVSVDLFSSQRDVGITANITASHLLQLDAAIRRYWHYMRRKKVCRLMNPATSQP